MEVFIKPKSKHRENRRKNIRGNGERNIHNNPFVLLDLETDSEEKHKAPTSGAEFEGKDTPTEKDLQAENFTDEVQMQERTEDTGEDTDMLTSDAGSEDQEWENALAREGLNLPAMAENWKAKGIENASKEEIRIVNDLFIARKRALLERQNRKLGVAKGNSSFSRSPLWKTSSSKQKKRRGRKTSGEALQELGMIMLNSGKMKALTAFDFFQ